MASLNKVLLMGNLTRNPEIRYTPSGSAVCEFGYHTFRRLATLDTVGCLRYNRSRKKRCDKRLASFR